MNFNTLEAVAKKLATKEVSSMELCQCILAQVWDKDPVIGAYSYLLAESALLEAQLSDERRQSGETKGLLDGIPIAIKDLIDTTPAVCAAGLAHLSTFRPRRDAKVVQALREAGAVIIGVTETDPGAFSTSTEKVTNPLAPGRNVGGSSGGSGAAVAAGMAYAALGTDTGGSIRIPAACCSVYGFKPTWGRVGATGVLPLAASLDHVGPLARCVTDLQIIQSVIDPGFHFDASEEPASPLVLGSCEKFYSAAKGRIKSSMKAVITLLRQHEVNVRQVTLPDPEHVVNNIQKVNLPKEAADYHTIHFQNEWPKYPDIARNTVRNGKACSEKAYLDAERYRAIAKTEVEDALTGVSAIVLPTMPIDAPLRETNSYSLGNKKMSKLAATVLYTGLFNQTGNPVVSMPAVMMADGRAISIQLIGRRDEDEQLLAIARKLEAMFSIHVDYTSIVTRQSGKRGSASDSGPS